jgi:ATP-dependent Clp protease protease subunit
VTDLIGPGDINGRYIIPSFVERTTYGVKEMNPYNKLFEDRIIFLGVQIDDASANDVMAQLLTLESLDPDRDISMYINSPGGSFTAMTAIYDTMQIHQPSTEGGGQGSDIEIQAREILRMRSLMEEIISRHSGRPVAQVRLDVERDKILTAEEAKEYGLIDDIIPSRKKRAAAIAS